MSVTLTLNKALPAYPFSIRWDTGEMRLSFDSILASYVGPNTGTLTQYHGPVFAWLQYTDPVTGRYNSAYSMLDIVFGDSTSLSQLVIQFELKLPSPIKVRANSPIILHFATPLSGHVPTESQTFRSTGWDVYYGIRGSYV